MLHKYRACKVIDIFKVVNKVAKQIPRKHIPVGLFICGLFHVYINS
jgi:hypothetical protein